MGRQMRGITSRKQFIDSRSQVGLGVLTAVMRAALRGVCLTGCPLGRWTQPSPALRLQRERGAPVRGLASGLPMGRWCLSVRPFWGNDRGSLLRNMIDVSLLGHRAGWRKFESEFGIVNGAYTRYLFFFKNLLIASRYSYSPNDFKILQVCLLHISPVSLFSSLAFGILSSGHIKVLVGL